jgi:hypothetical protein
MIQIPTEHVTVLLFFHFTVATASIRTVIEFFPSRTSYRHLSRDRDDSKCVIKRNLFYFMLMAREWEASESLRASIHFCILPAIYQG